MVRHLILWKLRDDIADKEAVLSGIKEGLEGLSGKIEGLKEIKVYTKGFDTSNVDCCLDSLFDDREALEGYAVNPIHVKVADEAVRPYTASRSCMDFEV